MEKIKLHVACGTVRIDGYINSDLRKVEGITDMIADCSNLPYEENTVDEILSFHVIEHFDEPGFEKLLKHWYHLLKNNGKVIVETPNLIGLTRRFLEEYDNNKITRPGYMFGCHSKIGRESIFNDNHLWGFSKESIKEYFEKNNFKNIIVSEGTDYHAKEYGEGFTIRCEGTKIC